MKKVLWFSQHTMSPSQKAALGDVEIFQVDGTMHSVYEPFLAKVNRGSAQIEVSSFKSLSQDFDILAVVAPIGIQKQILDISDGRPVIITKNNRVRIENDSFRFDFDHWEQLLKVEVVTQLWLPS